MSTHPKPKFTSLIAALAAVTVAGCGSGNTTVVTTVTTTAPAVAKAPGVYFVAGEQFVEGQRSGLDSQSDAMALMQALVAGPSESERKLDWWSDIPEGTKVLEARTDRTGGVTTAERLPEGMLRVRFDSTFETSAGRTASTRFASIYERLGQVVFTATSLPGIRKVRIEVEGTEPITLARADFLQPARKAAAQAAQSVSQQAPSQPQVTPQATRPKPTAPTAAGMGTREVQQRLAELGYLPAGSVSDTDDYRTRQAVMAFQGWEGLDRDGVAGPKTSARLKAASRPQPTAGGAARRIEIHRNRGVVLLVEGGRTVRAIHTSTGSGGDSPDTGTPPGRFRIYRKELKSWSVPFRTWLPYASYWNGGWALHEYGDVPNYPASHGCARIPKPEAPVVYAFATMGTQVDVI